MNGMAAKKLRKDHAQRWTEDGMPRDTKDWKVEDWMILYRHIRAAREEIVA